MLVRHDRLVNGNLWNCTCMTMTPWRECYRFFRTICRCINQPFVCVCCVRWFFVTSAAANFGHSNCSALLEQKKVDKNKKQKKNNIERRTQPTNVVAIPTLSYKMDFHRQRYTSSIAFLPGRKMVHRFYLWLAWMLHTCRVDCAPHSYHFCRNEKVSESNVICLPAAPHVRREFFFLRDILWRTLHREYRWMALATIIDRNTRLSWQSTEIAINSLSWIVTFVHIAYHSVSPPGRESAVNSIQGLWKIAHTHTPKAPLINIYFN